jgi:hypothetical protein
MKNSSLPRFITFLGPSLLALLAGGWLGRQHFSQISEPTGLLRAEDPVPAASRLPWTPRDFGAAGDGKTDDTAALRKAIASGNFRLTRGAYLIRETLEIDLAANGFFSLTGDSSASIVMAGPGPALRIRGTHGGTADPTSVKPEIWQNERFPTVSGVEIVGAHEEADGIEAVGTMKLTLHRLLIRQVRHGVRLRERNRNVLIADCHIYENRGIGVWLDHVNLHQTNINACHISYCRGGGIVVQGGDVRNVQIAGCDIEGNMSPETLPTANVLFDCADGSVAEAAIVGCTIQHNAKSPESANIRFRGRGKVPRQGELLEFQCGNVTISDNVLSDVHHNIELTGVRGATIVGNTLWQGYTSNLTIDDCAQVVISANVLERNPLYGYTTEACDRVCVRNSRDLTIQGLHIHQVREAEAGFVLENCDRVLMTGCSVLDCDGPELLVRNVRRSLIAHCQLRDDRPDGDRAASDKGASSLEVQGANPETRFELNGLETAASPGKN